MRAPTSRAARSCCGAAPASARARSACWRPAASPRSRWCAGRRWRCSRPATNWWRRAAARPGAGLRQQRRDRRGGGRGSRRRAGAVRRFPGRRGRARAGGAHARSHACDMVRAVGRHLEGRGRPLAPHRLEARRARHPRARRRAQARQAALPRGDRRQAARGAAGISDLGDLHLPRLRRAGDPRPRRAAAGSRAHASRPTCRCALRPSSAARNSCWSRWSRASDGPVAFPTAKGSGSVTSFSQADGFLEIDALATALDAGTPRPRHADRRDRARCPIWSSWAATTSRSTRCSARSPSGLLGAHHRGRQPRRRGGGRARRMRPRAGASGRSGERRLQRASAAPRPCAGEGLAAHAGRRAIAPATRASRAAAPPTRSRPRSPTPTA